MLLSVALFLQMLFSLPGLSAQPNLSCLSCSDLSLSPVNAILCSCILTGTWQWLNLSCFESCCSLASWHCFCVLSHLSGISHSLLNCHLQPPLGLCTIFLHFLLGLHMKATSQKCLETLPLNPSFDTTCAKTQQN